MMDPCRPPERLWCCASAETQDIIGIYGVSTVPFFLPFSIFSFALLPSPPHSQFVLISRNYIISQVYEKLAKFFQGFFVFPVKKEHVGLTFAPAPPAFAPRRDP